VSAAQRQFLAASLLIIAVIGAVWIWRSHARGSYAPPRRDAAFWRRRVAGPDTRTSAKALKRLTLIGGDRNADLIANTLKHHESGFVRATAAECLGRLARPEHVPALRAALKDADSRVSDEAIRALGAVGNKPAFDALADALDGASQYKTVMIVVRMPDFKMSEAEDKLISLLDHKSAWVRWRVIRSLGQVGTQRCVPRLKRLVGDPMQGTDYKAPEFSKHDLRGIVERMLADAIAAASQRPPWPSAAAAEGGGT
jgi:HEAT repeat protein